VWSGRWAMRRSCGVDDAKATMSVAVTIRSRHVEVIVTDCGWTYPS
jgi:hypothetical protein